MKAMQHRGSESKSFTATEDESFRSELSEAGPPLLDSVARGKDAIAAVTAEAMNSAGADLTALRADLNGLKDTVTKFISQVSSEAAKSAREVTSSVADQVGGVATDYVGKGAEMTSAASEQAKTVVSELECMARRNPLVAIAGAVLIGILIGLLGRRNGQSGS
jgi:ElaB/YqjD/DUF883 family membrane-anchored ribosome-binding protein